MLSKRFSLLFHLKKPKNYVRGKQPIYFRITINGERIELSTQREWEPEKWNADAGRANGIKEESKLLNDYLNSLRQKVHEAHLTLIDRNLPITVDNIKKILRGEYEQRRMIIETFQSHNDQLSQLVGKHYSATTLKRYKTSLGHTQNFINWKYNTPDIDIAKINHEFVSDYEFWLKSIRHCNHNSTMKYLGNFKKIIQLCLKRGWITKDPFAGFRLTKQEVERPFLTELELKKLASKDFPTERLNYVRDIFLFSCFTGLAYVDVKKLKRSEIVIGIDGEKWVYTKRQKTDTSSRIPLLASSLEIINRHSDHPQCVNEGRLLPVLSNQKMNAYLKEIADVCGINKNLTFHIARHTFATTVTLNNGVPIESVSKMLGHKNLRTTQHYAKILDKKVSEDMTMLRKKISESNLL
jgi:site-specific recombinase XerD